MLLSETRFVEIYRKIDGYRTIKINGKDIKVSYEKDHIFYDTQNEISLLWLLRKVLHNGWIPYAKGTMFGINQPLEIDEHFRTGEFENVYQVTDPLGHELSLGILSIHYKHTKEAQKNYKNAILEKVREERAEKALKACVTKYKNGQQVPPTILPLVKEYIRNASFKDGNYVIE